MKDTRENILLLFRFACLPKRVMKRFPSAKLRVSWG